MILDEDEDSEVVANALSSVYFDTLESCVVDVVDVSRLV